MCTLYILNPGLLQKRQAAYRGIWDVLEEYDENILCRQTMTLRQVNKKQETNE